MSPIKKAMKSAQMIIVFSIISRALSLTKESLIASKIGNYFTTDSYFTAFVASTLLADIIGEGISTSMVPILLRIEAKEGKEKKIEYVNNMLHLAILFSLALIMLSWILSPIVIKIMAKGFLEDEFNLSVKLMKVGLPIILFIIVRSVFIAFLQSNHGFKAGAKSWAYYNMVYIVFLVFFNRFRVVGLMVAGILASAIQLYSVIPASVKLGYNYERVIDFKDIYLKELLIMIMPIVIGISINKVNVVVDKSIASTLAAGSISWLNYANDIIQVILGIFVTAIVTVFFPIIAQEFNREDVRSLSTVMGKGTHLVVGITLPVSVILMTLSEPIVELLFQRGRFGPIATMMTSKVLFYYALGLGNMALILILTKAHYAMHNSITPMIASLIGVALNYGLNIVLSKYMGVKGLALATTISTTVVAILLIKDLNNKVKVIEPRLVVKNSFRMLVISGIMAAIILLVFNLWGKMVGDGRVGSIVQLLVSIGTGIGFYIQIIKLMMK